MMLFGYDLEAAGVPKHWFIKTSGAYPTTNQGVVGSNPAGRAIKSRAHSDVSPFHFWQRS